MKVILLYDVPKFGRKFEIKSVSDGYAKNFLLNKKLALIATPEIVKKMEAEKRKIEEGKITFQTEAIKKLSALCEVSISAKASESGSLFSGIKGREILELINKKAGLGLLDENLIYEKPIKQTGEHILSLKIGEKNIKIKLTINSV